MCLPGIHYEPGLGFQLGTGREAGGATLGPLIPGFHPEVTTQRKELQVYTKVFILMQFIMRRCVRTIQVGPQGTHHNLWPKSPPRPFHSSPPQITVQFPPSVLSLCLWKILQRLKNQISFRESPLLGRLELLEMDTSWPHTSLALMYAVFVI